MHRRPALLLVATVALGAAACSDEDREDVSDVVETAARNIAAEQGEEQFSDAGHPLDDEGLTCEATAADGAEAVDISCTGTTEDGAAAELTGTTSELPGAS